MALARYNCIPGDDIYMEQVFNDLTYRVLVQGLAPSDSPEFTNLTLSGNLVIPDDGTIGSDTSNNAITIETLGGVTFSDVVTSAGCTVKDSDGNIVFHVDDDELYFAAEPVPITGGIPIGLAIGITYDS